MGAAAHPIRSEVLFSISRLFPYKRHIVRCVYLRQNDDGADTLSPAPTSIPLFKISASATGRLQTISVFVEQSFSNADTLEICMIRRKVRRCSSLKETFDKKMSDFFWIHKYSEMTPCVFFAASHRHRALNV